MGGAWLADEFERCHDRFLTKIPPATERAGTLAFVGYDPKSERKQNQFVQMRNRMAAIEGKIAAMNPDGTKKTFGMGV